MGDLGVMGESTFSLWCADAGLTANKSDNDKTGWDFIVEFPFSKNGSNVDVHNAALECKVQVKATNKRDRKLQVKLSNLKRMATAPVPSFFVFIEFDKRSVAQSAYIVHVDNSLITKILERIYKLEQEGFWEKLHKKKMTISYGDSEKLGRLDGEAIKETIMAHVGNDLSRYIARKRDHLATTGFESGRFEMSFKTEGRENLESLIDMSLGVKKEIDVSGVKAFEKRFGIPKKDLMIEDMQGSLSISDVSHDAEGHMTIRESNLSPGITFKAKLYVTPLYKMLPKGFKVARIEGDFFNFFIYPDLRKIQCDFSFPEELKLKVRELRDALKLIDLLYSKNRKLYVEFSFLNNPALHGAFSCEEKRVLQENEIEALEACVQIVNHYGYDDVVEASLNEILLYKRQIIDFAKILKGNESKLNIEFNVVEGDFEATKPLAAIFFSNILIGSHIFGGFFTLKGDVVKREDGKYTLTNNYLVLEHVVVVEKGKEVDNDDLEEIRQSIEAKYEEEYIVMDPENSYKENG